jgi:chromate transport protein ChrA
VARHRGTTRIRVRGVFIAVTLVALTPWLLMAVLTFLGREG